MEKTSYLDAAVARITAALLEEEESGQPKVIEVIRGELVQSFRNGLKAARRPQKSQKAA